MTVKEVSLDQLVENDYNPRKTFSDAKMEELKESIDKVGLIEPLAAREVNGRYEVIAGARRFKAMQQLDYGDSIPINVLDVDTEDAKLIALSENLERSELLPTEEAEAFAEYVEVEIPSSAAEKMGEKVEFRVEEDSGGRSRYYANYNEYINHLKGGVKVTSSSAIRVPSDTSESVRSAAETIPGATTSQIEDRLALLVLPQALQNAVDNGELAQDKARAYAHFRELDDFERMQEEVLKLYQQHDDGSGVDLSPSQIRDEVDQRIDEIEKEEERRRELVGEWLRNAADRQKELARQNRKVRENAELDALCRVQEYAQREDVSLTEAAAAVGPEVNAELLTHDEDADQYAPIGGVDLEDLPAVVDPNGSALRQADQFMAAAKQLRSKLSVDREDEIDEEIAELEKKANRLRQTKQEIADENLDHCPHCHSGTSVPTLRDEIDKLQSRIDGLQQDVEQISDAREELRDTRRDLRDPARQYRSALTKLMEEDGADDDHPIAHVELDDDGNVAVRELNEDIDAIDDFSADEADGLLEDVAYLETEG